MQHFLKTQRKIFLTDGIKYLVGSCGKYILKKDEKDEKVEKTRYVQILCDYFVRTYKKITFNFLLNFVQTNQRTLRNLRLNFLFNATVKAGCAVEQVYILAQLNSETCLY
jgi:hypothetical protein